MFSTRACTLLSIKLATKFKFLCLIFRVEGKRANVIGESTMHQKYRDSLRSLVFGVLLLLPVYFLQNIVNFHFYFNFIFLVAACAEYSSRMPQYFESNNTISILIFIQETLSSRLSLLSRSIPKIKALRLICSISTQNGMGMSCLE